MGADQKIYKTTNLGQTVPAVTSTGPSSEGVSFSAYSLINFSEGPAAMALVDPNGNVLQFISYGTSSDETGIPYKALNGSAEGLVALDIGVFEPSNSPLTHSLQLSGVGTFGDDFFWNMPRYGTPGKINEGQVFLCDFD